MANPHDHAVFGFRSHLQASRECLPFRKKRMIAPYLEPLRQTFEQALAAMPHDGAFAVHRVVENTELSAESFDDSLQPQAHTEQGYTSAGGESDEIGNAKIRGPAGAGRNQDQA